MKDKSFKRITFAALASIALLLIGCFYFIDNAQNEMYAEKVMLLSEISVKDALLVKNKVTDLENKLKGMALMFSEEEELDLDFAIKMLTGQTEINEFKRMGVALPDGRAYTTENHVVDFSQRTYFQKALAGVSCVSERLTDVIDGASINVYACPIYGIGDSIIGVIFGTTNTELTAQLMAVNSFGGEGYSYIIHSDGTPVIFTRNPRGPDRFENLFDLVSEDPANVGSLAVLKENMKNGKSDTQRVMRDGVERQMSYVKIGVEDWYMVSTVATSVISHGTEALISRIIFGTGVIFIMLVCLGLYIVGHFRKNSQRLEEIAYIDDVTGYSNWNGFRRDCQELLAKYPYRSYCMVTFDIGKFKVINDIYGYDKGNKLLRYISDVVNSLKGKNDCFARVSADNFSIFMEYDTRDQIKDKVHDITRQVENYIDDYHIDIPFGIYILDEGLTNVSLINDRANLAKRAIKNRVDINYNFYDGAVRSNILREKEIENYMETALKQREFELYLQPKYRLDNGKMVGAEALVRWNHPEKGLVMPNNFIPLFEKNGFVKKIDMYMFEHVCEIIDSWNRNDINSDINISVNLSRIHLSNMKLPADLMGIADEYDVDTGRIEIELTESAVFDDVNRLIEIIREFSAVGFAVSIDDFGSGYSSLNTLKDLPVDIIKLDRGFLQETTDNERSKLIVRSLIEMARKLNIHTVAEGVETVEQIEFLRDAGCDLAQGYYYAKPVQVSEFERLAQENREEYLQKA